MSPWGASPPTWSIRNGRWVNVHSGEIIPGTDIAIAAGRFAYCGPDAEPRHRAGDPGDRGGGRYLVPGLCDGHMHVESGMVTVTEFCRAVIPHGTTSMFIDPHEIANVLGLAGVRLMHDEAMALPINVYRRRCRAACRARPGWRMPAPSLGVARGRRGDDLAQHHRARRDDELSRASSPTIRRCWRDRRDPEGRQDGRRPLRLARPRAGRSTPMSRAARPTTMRARAPRTPSRACGRACGRCCGSARPGTTSRRRSRR